MRIILSLLFLQIVSFVSSQIDPCTSYQPLDSADEYVRSVANSVGSICDNTLVAGWYRITSKAGERMPTECIYGGGRCGTTYSIWMDGTYPESGVVKNVTACASGYNGDCCEYSYDIEVKNCSNFLVYKLVPVTPCYQAYCFGTELPCPEGQTSDNGFSPECKFDPCHRSNYEILKGEMKRSSNYSLTVDDIAIEDSRLPTRWYRIESMTGNDIVNESVQMMQCGTLYPLWMQGSIPEVGENTVDRKACRSGLTGPCDEEYDIQVRNCGDFRTYYLQQLNVDKSAYCFGTLPVPEKTTTVKPDDDDGDHDSGEKDDDDDDHDNDRKDGGEKTGIIAVVIVLVLMIAVLSIILAVKICTIRSLKKRSISCVSIKAPASAYVISTYPPSYYEAVLQNDKNNHTQSNDRDYDMFGHTNGIVGNSVPPRSLKGSVI